MLYGLFMAKLAPGWFQIHITRQFHESLPYLGWSLNTHHLAGLGLSGFTLRALQIHTGQKSIGPEPENVIWGLSYFASKDLCHECYLPMY